MSDSDGIPGPSIGVLRAASANLVIDRLGDQFRQSIDSALRVERYYLAADALRVPRQRAAEILANVQNEWAGSTPTEQQLERAHCDLIEEGRAATMPEELWAVVQRLATETKFSVSDITAAVDVLQSRAEYLAGPPWSVARIVSTLPKLADGAAMGDVIGLVSFVANVRAVCA